MLVLTRREGEKIYIGTDITITFVENRGDKVRIGIEAPQDVPIMRAELGKPKKHYTNEIPRVLFLDNDCDSDDT